MALLFGASPLVGICAFASLFECFNSLSTSETRYIKLLILLFLLSPADRRRLARRRHVYEMATTSDLMTRMIRMQLISKDVVALQD